MNTLEQIARLLGTVLLPFAEVFDRADDDIAGFAEKLGYVLPSLPPSLKNLQAASQELVVSLTTLNQRTVTLEEEEDEDTETESEQDSELLSAIGEVIIRVSALLNSISNLKSSPAAELPPAFVATTNIANDFETRLLDWVIWNAIEDQAPLTRQILTLLGILESSEFAEDTVQFRPEFELKRVRWERVPAYLDDPGAVFRDVYGWGTPDLDFDKLVNVLVELSRHTLSPAEIGYPTTSFMDAIAPGSSASAAEIDPYLRWQLINLGILSVAAILYATPKVNPGDVQGVALTLVANGDLNQTFTISDQLALEFKASMNLALGLALVFRPGQVLRVVNDVLSGGAGTPVLTGQALLKLIYGSTTSPVRILNLPGGSYLQTDTLYIAVGAGLVTADTFDALVEIGLQSGVVSLNMSETDGFLKSILPGDGIKLNFDIGLGWTRTQGVYFKGSAALEIQIPTHITLGPINLNKLYLIAGIEGFKLPLEISSEIGANLGPLAATVERLGIKLIFDFPGSGGNLGPVDLGFAFKPPNGLGLSLDTGVVKGGGYLFFDPDKEEYAGVLELSFSGIVTVTAIGLLTTRMPDGSRGFSLLIIISVEFGTGIQLGFGFTLIGLGGLLGLNRIMRLQALMDGVRTGAINHIMFPRDVVANAPRIISDLKTIFPPENGRFLIGPFAKIGWGTPTLISLSLGVIIEIPPGNIAIIGVLRVALPADQVVLIVLQVNFAGAIEIDKKRIFFFASLFESRVIFITIEGEMGLLVAFGVDANFVLSVGGFHPRFNPPPLPFPSPVRVALNIISESYARIRVQGYFGVTSNTVQFGAHAELYFGLSAVSVEGHIGFDVLIQFSPFYFIAEISASVSLNIFGMGLFSIHLRFSLEGPTPWRARGSGSISFFFFSVSADFDFTWGESRDTSLPPISVVPILAGEFEKIENWQALLPSGNNLLVSLRKLEGPADTLVLHPVGTLRVSQKAVPLGLNIDKVGNQKPNDANSFSLTVAASVLSKKGDYDEQFAIGQYQDMDDASKLSRPAFQRQHGGIEISVAGQQIKSARIAKRIVRYEEVIIDNNYKRHIRHFFEFFGTLFVHFLKGASVARSTLSQEHQMQLQPFPQKIAVGEEAFTVAFQATNKAFSVEATFASEVAAREFMRQQITLEPNQVETLHVIPHYEVMP
jgi:hypothetical protein